MARGNDAKAAAAEFRGQYGLMGNAEDLIEANRAAYPADLRAANLLPVDDETELDRDKVLGAVEGGKVLAFVKRGDYVIAVVETESGHVYKQVIPAHEVSDAPEPQQTEADSERAQAAEAEARQADADQQARLILANARLEAEKIVADAVTEANEKASEQAQAAKDEANEVQHSAADEAPAPAEASASSGDAPARRRAKPDES